MRQDHAFRNLVARLDGDGGHGQQGESVDNTFERADAKLVSLQTIVSAAVAERELELSFGNGSKSGATVAAEAEQWTESHHELQAATDAYRDGSVRAPEWDDHSLPEDEAIAAAHPMRTGRHDLYQEAMRLVGAKHSKAALVELVNWLLAKQESAGQDRDSDSPPFGADATAVYSLSAGPRVPAPLSTDVCGACSHVCVLHFDHGTHAPEGTTVTAGCRRGACQCRGFEKAAAPTFAGRYEPGSDE